MSQVINSTIIVIKCGDVMTKEIAGTPWWGRKVRDIYIYLVSVLFLCVLLNLLIVLEYSSLVVYSRLIIHTHILRHHILRYL